MQQGRLLHHLDQPPPKRVRPSTTFLVLLAFLLGVPAALGGLRVALMMAGLGAFGLGMWFFLRWLTKPRILLLAIYERGLLVWSKENPQESIPWSQLRSLAYLSFFIRRRFITRLWFDCGKIVTLTRNAKELLAIAGEVTQLAQFKQVELRRWENRFPGDASQAWARDERLLPTRLWFLLERVIILAVFLVGGICIVWILLR